jgi:heme-degrading monooxygenase HmoA
MVEDRKAENPLLKWIVCRVRPGRRLAYSAAQGRWAPVAKCAGFLGQGGGWAASDERVACVLASWSDPPAYAAFMANDHDRIAAQAGIAPTIEAGSATLFARVCHIPSRRFDTLEDALPEAAFLRIADCKLTEGREERFIRSQREIWNPGMTGSDGMLAGAFCRDAANASRFLVASLWESKEAHDAYVAGVFPELRRRARPEDDIDAMESRRIELLDDWLVRGAGAPTEA